MIKIECVFTHGPLHGTVILAANKELIRGHNKQGLVVRVPTLISLEDPQSLFILRQCGRSESHQAIQSSPLMASYSDISYSRGVDKFTRYVTWPLVRTVSKY